MANFGSTATFRGYGLICLGVLGAFIFINFYRVDQGFVSDLPTTEDPRQVAEETSHLAPHGVPSNPIPRALSSSKLHELAQDSYGTTYQTTGDGSLGVPGAVANPFAQPDNGQRYSGYQVRSKYFLLDVFFLLDPTSRHFFVIDNFFCKHCFFFVFQMSSNQSYDTGGYSSSITTIQTQQPEAKVSTNYDW